MEIKKLKSAVTRIKSIVQRDVKTAKGGTVTIIVLNTEDGNFSNFASVWEKQNIDVKALSGDDLVEIQYTTFVNPKTKFEYKNFMFVSVVSPTSGEQTSDEPPSDESLLAEITNGINEL